MAAIKILLKHTRVKGQTKKIGGLNSREEEKCIGSSLRAIEPAIGNITQALAQNDKRVGSME